MTVQYGILTGAVVGFCYGVIGKTANSDEFSWGKFLPDIIVSAIAGGLIGASGEMPSQTAMQSTLGAMGALGINKVVRKIYQAIKFRT